MKNMDQYKIAMIYGEDSIEHQTQDGQIEYFGNALDENTLHITTFVDDIIAKKYSDVNLLKKITWRHQPEVPAFFLSKMFNHSIFLNTTSDIEKYGKTGMFILSDQLSDKQQESLLAFCKTIHDYNIKICYQLELNEGLIDSRNFGNDGVEKHTPLELMEYYLENVYQKEKRL